MKMNSIKNVVIYGVGGLYNYGCEATVRSVAAMIKKSDERCNITYVTRDYEKDKKILSDVKYININEIKLKTSFIGKCVRKLKRIIGVGNNYDNLPYSVEWLSDCDVLIIVGGDVFNLVPSEEGSFWYRSNERISVGKIAKQKGAKVIIWGLSAGPFEKNKRAKKIIIDFFENWVDRIIVREPKTYDYLKCNGVTKLSLYNDPAYAVRKDVKDKINTDELTVGLNLSPLSNVHMKSRYNEEEYIKRWVKVIEQIYKKNVIKKFILLPHVVSETMVCDDDLAYLNKICNEMKQKNIPVSIVNNDPGFIGIKKYICQCDLVLAARMHCAINSITCSVPTVFLAYSEKAKGMCKQVYGNYNMCIDMNEIIDGNIDTCNLFETINKIEQLHRFLQEKSISMYENTINAIEAYNGVINND